VFCEAKSAQNSFLAGASPRTPMGNPTTVPTQLLQYAGEEYPLPFLIHSTSEPLPSLENFLPKFLSKIPSSVIRGNAARDLWGVWIDVGVKHWKAKCGEGGLHSLSRGINVPECGYILSNGVIPNNRRPLETTVLAASYNTSRLYIPKHHIPHRIFRVHISAKWSDLNITTTTTTTTYDKKSNISTSSE